MAVTPRVIEPYDTPGLPYDSSTERYYDGYPSGIPFAYRVLLQDSNGVAVAWLTDKIIAGSLRFAFNRIGGCADGGFQLYVADFFEYDDDLTDYRVQVFINSQGSNDLTCVYSGFITDDAPVLGEPSKVAITMKGFSDMATRLIAGMRADGTIQYGAPDGCQWAGGTALVDIVKDLASKLPDFAPIAYNASYIDDPGLDLVNVLSMQKTAYECFNDLATLAGNYQWGVDQNRNFFFKAPSSAALTCWYGAGLSDFSVATARGAIKNRCLVQDGLYTDTYEAEADLAVQQQQTLHTDDISCGANSVQAVRQTFVTNKRSISRVRLSVKMLGSAATNMITDGDMEASGTASWPGIFLTDALAKDTAFKAFGSQGLKCTVRVPWGGTVRTLTTVVGVTYSLRWWHWVNTGRFKVTVDNALTGSSREVLAVSDEYQRGDKDQKTFKQNFLSFTATTTTTKIWFQSPYGNALFYMDDVVVIKNPGLIEVSLLNADTGDILASDSNLVNNTAAYADIDFDLHYYGAHVDGITTYALDIRPVALDGAADEIYWKLESDDAGSITSGALTYYNGSSWAAASGALKLDLYYNTSQESCGLRMEQMTPVVNGADNKEYVNAYLAGISTPQRRVTATLDKQRTVLHAGLPSAGLGLFDARMPLQGSTINQDQIEALDYTVGDNGLTVGVTAGKRLPELAYQLEWLKHKLQTFTGLNS